MTDEKRLTSRQRLAQGLPPGPKRETFAYANPPAHYMLVDGAVDPNVPEEGYYTTRLGKGAILSAVRIWYGQSFDPKTGEQLDRFTWLASINNEPVSVLRVWPHVAKSRIDVDEYNRIIGLMVWAKTNDPDGAYANPKKAVDPLKAPIPF